MSAAEAETACGGSMFIKWGGGSAPPYQKVEGRKPPAPRFSASALFCLIDSGMSLPEGAAATLSLAFAIFVHFL